MTTDDRITINPSAIEIKSTPVADLKGLTLSTSTIRENAGETTITMTVELAKVLDEDTPVVFRLFNYSEDEAEEVDREEVDGVAVDGLDAVQSALEAFFAGTVEGVRDVDYEAILGTATIGAKEGKATATLTITPIDNGKTNSAIGLRVQAKVGTDVPLWANFKITDDETLTTRVTLSADPDTVTEGTGRRRRLRSPEP